jgi:hypothetical protein
LKERISFSSNEVIKVEVADALPPDEGTYIEGPEEFSIAIPFLRTDCNPTRAPEVLEVAVTLIIMDTTFAESPMYLSLPLASSFSVKPLSETTVNTLLNTVPLLEIFVRAEEEKAFK